MTSGNKKLKREARERARRLNISYTAARRQLLTGVPAPSPQGTHVFTVTHIKGGSGVSTLAAGLAQAWAHQGHRVLLVDTTPDFLGGAATLTGLSPEAEKDGLTLAGFGPEAAADGSLSARLEQVRGEFDLVVVDLCVLHAYGWDEAPGHTLLVPVRALLAKAFTWVQIIDHRPLHVQMWASLSSGYATYCSQKEDEPTPEDVAFEALTEEKSEWLETLPDEEFHAWMDEHAPHPAPKPTPQEFLAHIADHAEQVWGTTWAEHGAAWPTWHNSDSRGPVEDVEHVRHVRDVPDAADQLLDLWHWPVDIPVGGRIVRVANRQRALPTDVRPLVEPVRAELATRGVRTTATAIPENTGLPQVHLAGRTQFTDLPPVMRERFTSLAAELWH